MKDQENRLSWNLSDENTNLWTDMRRMIYSSTMDGNFKETKNHLHLLLDDMYPLIKEKTFMEIEGKLGKATTMEQLRIAKRDLYKAMKDEADIYHFKVEKRKNILGVFDR